MDFHSDRGLNSGQGHIEPVLYGHGPGVAESWELKFPVHFLDQLFVGHARGPLLTWFEHDGRVIHIERGIVGSAVRTAHCAEYRLHFWKGAENSVLLLQQLGGFDNGDAW